VVGLSALLAGGITRLGAVDLTEPQYVAELEATRGVVVLDLSGLGTSDPLNHSKFATSPEVVRLLGDRLTAGQPFDRSGAVFANAADAIGGAVGGVAVAPIVLFANRPGE
jgi:esterase/lipase superfamily enzyme